MPEIVTIIITFIIFIILTLFTLLSLLGVGICIAEKRFDLLWKYMLMLIVCIIVGLLRWNMIMTVIEYFL